MKILIQIIRSVLHGEKFKTKIDENLLELAKFHSVAPFLYPCMDKEVTEKEIADRVTEIYFSSARCDLIQLCEREALEADFEKAQIPYLALKGMVMKSLYPQTHLRTMGDLDYLVSLKDFDTAKKIIIEHGYKADLNCEHHLEFNKPPFMIVELHRLLIEKDEIGRELLEDVLSRCKVKAGKSYALEMSDEDFYLHLMLHLLFHYVQGGTGLRSFIDIYIYLKAKPSLNREYLSASFAKTEYASTVALIERFSYDLFEGNALDEEEKAMLLRVASSGTYGTLDNLVQSDLQKNNNSTAKLVVRKLFPTVRSMKGWYPVLNRGAGILLLPFFYVWHVLTRVFSKRSYVRVKEMNRAKKKNKGK
ncbi:MAG: nucleotidyltransferase family protein [Candidatus Coproplasma sp.]